MRRMSWSRYRCLSWSFMRIRASLRHDRLARAGHKVTAAAISAPAAAGAPTGRRPRQSPAAENTGAGRPAPSERDPQPGCFEPKQGPAIPMSDAPD
jgi:hypothetical protein